MYTTGLLPTGPLSDWIPLFSYTHAHYQTTTNRPITRLYTCTTVLPGPEDWRPLSCYQQVRYQTVYLVYCLANHRPTTRLYTTILLPTWPLPDCILLYYYPQAHYQTVYYCSTTHRPTTRLYTTVLLPTCPLPDCILLLYYPHAH